ncbi:uncharacterized protein [Oscarella lobularis]|uniref:uncharacterized protein isoform X2 n=2 Tax=Oscarella lobularis TaxID=121494 RepID=UPI003313F88C
MTQQKNDSGSASLPLVKTISSPDAVDILCERGFINFDQFDIAVCSVPRARFKYLFSRVKPQQDEVSSALSLRDTFKERTFRLYMDPKVVEELSISGDVALTVRKRIVQSLARAWGATASDIDLHTRASAFTRAATSRRDSRSYSLIIRRKVLIRIELNGPIDVANKRDTWDKIKVALTSTSKTSTKSTVAVQQFITESKTLVLLVPGGMALSVLLSFSNIKHQLLFFRHLGDLLPSEIRSLSFFLGSFPPIRNVLLLGERRGGKKPSLMDRNNVRAPYIRCRRRSTSAVFALVDHATGTISEVEEKIAALENKIRNLVFEVKETEFSDRLQESITQSIKNSCFELCEKIVSLRQKLKSRLMRREHNVVEKKIAVPPDFIGYVLGRGFSRLQRIKEESGASIDFDDENQVFYVKGTEQSVAKAFKIFSNTVVKRKRYYLRNPDHRDDVRQRRSAIVTKVVEGKALPHYIWRRASAKFGCRLSYSDEECQKVRVGGRLRGTEDMQREVQQYLDDVITEKKYSVSLNDLCVDAWFHLGRCHWIHPEGQDSISKTSFAEPPMPWRIEFRPGLLSICSRLERFLQRCSECHSYVRHDLTIVTPSYNLRRLIVVIPPANSSAEETYSRFAKHYPVLKMCQTDGDGVMKAGPGYLCYRMQPDFRVDILMPDLSCDCRFFIRIAETLSSQAEDDEDKVLIQEYCSKVKVLGNCLNLPELPEGYLLDYHRRSKRKMYVFEDHEVCVSREEELESAQTLWGCQESKATEIHVKNRHSEKTFRSSTIRSWNTEAIKDEINCTLHFVRALVSHMEPI